MKYFRHPPLLFWLSAVLILVALYIFASTNSNGISQIRASENVTPAASRGAAHELLTRVSGVYPSVTSGELQKWATETAEIAQRGKILAAQSKPYSADLVTAWDLAIDAATDLSAADPSDRALVIELIAKLGYAGNQVAAVANTQGRLNAITESVYVSPQTSYAPTRAGNS